MNECEHGSSVSVRSIKTQQFDVAKDSDGSELRRDCFKEDCIEHWFVNRFKKTGSNQLKVTCRIERFNSLQYCLGHPVVRVHYPRGLI